MVTDYDAAGWRPTKGELDRFGREVPDDEYHTKDFERVVALRARNWIDLSKIEAERALFVRYNRSLTNYYARALKKERSRDHLLKQQLGMDKVVHYVVSRFPVIGADPAVINYNQIDRLRFAGQAGA